MSTDDGIIVRGLLEAPGAKDDLAALKARALADPMIVGNLVGPNARHTVLMVRTDFMNEQDSGRGNTAMAALAAEHAAPGFQPRMTGTPHLNQALNDQVIDDMRRLVVAAGIVMFIMLVFLFRHPMGVWAPFTVVGMASVWTLGAMVSMPMVVSLSSPNQTSGL